METEQYKKKDNIFKYIPRNHDVYNLTGNKQLKCKVYSLYKKSKLPIKQDEECLEHALPSTSAVQSS